MLLKNKIQTQNVDNQVITPPPPPFITILNKGVKKIFLLFIGLLLFSCSEDKPEVAEKEKKEYPGKLSFIKLKRVVSDGKTITVEQLFKQIKDAKKKGFTLKNIHLEDNAKKFVRITGEKPNFTLELLAIGTFTATIVLEHKDYLDKKIQAEFEVAAQQFTFTKFVRDDSSGTKKITADQLLAQIPNAKTQGYTLKSIAISDASFATVSGTKPNLQITLLKPGTFTANIVLEHTSLFEVKIDKAAFEIKLETFVFNKLVRYFADSKTITAKHLLAQMPNAKTKGYTLKAIVISDTSFATISGTKPNLQITLLKPGTFTANLILENPAYFDTKIERALFEISTGAAPSFTFNKLTRNFNGSKIITAAQIIKQIPNASNNGYTLKSITISDTSFARVSGAKPYLQITILKAGTFTAKIVLEKTGYSDATIAAGVFEISTSATPNFIFNKLTRNFSDSKTITTAQILKQIPNASGSGYTLKSIAISDTSFATVSGTKPNLRITLLKPGTFTARIVLEKKNYNDATLAAGVFEINKGTAPNFTFNKLTRNFNGSKIITAAQIIKQIPNASGSGYTLKSIALSDASFATVSGTKPYLQITILKAGTFTAKIVLEKTGYSDATIAAGAFEINKGTAPNFTFNKLTRNFSGSKIITAAQIIKQIPNASGSGYTLKSIAISDASFATVSGAKPYLQITILKTGTFTAKIVLEKTGYSDATIAAGAFEITKVAAPTNLNFDKLTITYSAGKIISKNELLARIRNINGYTLKSIDQISDVSVASVVSAKPNFEIRIKKPGSFTVRMILEKDSNHKDVEITAAFDIARRIEKFTFTPWIRNSTQGKIISTDQILAQIPTAKSKKYTLKSITIADGSFAKVRGTKPNLNIELLKTGKFTANIVLEHNNYFDVEIKGAKFEFKYVKITFDKQYRHHITGLSPVHKSIQQTTDGGYIVAGYTYGSNNQIDLNDIWVLKLDSSGTKTWEQTYGGSKDDRAYAIQQTTDGGYIVAGYTRSKGAGGYDFLGIEIG